MNKPTQPKKNWETPELYILDSPNAKNHPNVHEKTGFTSGPYFSTINGGQRFTGTKNQAAS